MHHFPFPLFGLSLGGSLAGLLAGFAAAFFFLKKKTILYTFPMLSGVRRDACTERAANMMTDPPLAPYVTCGQGGHNTCIDEPSEAGGSVDSFTAADNRRFS